jgi:hypothetical protein
MDGYVNLQQFSAECEWDYRSAVVYPAAAQRAARVQDLVLAPHPPANQRRRNGRRGQAVQWLGAQLVALGQRLQANPAPTPPALER